MEVGGDIRQPRKTDRHINEGMVRRGANVPTSDISTSAVAMEHLAIEIPPLYHRRTGNRDLLIVRNHSVRCGIVKLVVVQTTASGSHSFTQHCVHPVAYPCW